MNLRRVFLYEFLTGGGCWEWNMLPAGGLLAEGSAMLHALAEDFAAVVPEVHCLWDARLPETLLSLPQNITRHAVIGENASEAFHQVAKRCDAAFLIAPETNGALLRSARELEQLGIPLLSPSAEFIALTANKNETALRLAAAGISVPSGRDWQPSEPWPPSDVRFPCVIKPADSCGSDRVRLISQLDFPPEFCGSNSNAWRIEAFQPGIAASISVLCGDSDHLPLAVTRQCLSEDGYFTYLGSELLLSSSLQYRAEKLARAALAALPKTRGYIGFDLVLGTAADGSEDFIIEVNPRLTTSYTVLKRHYRTNLAAAMVQMQSGESVTLEPQCNTGQTSNHSRP